MSDELKQKITSCLKQAGAYDVGVADPSSFSPLLARPGPTTPTLDPTRPGKDDDLLRFEEARSYLKRDRGCLSA